MSDKLSTTFTKDDLSKEGNDDGDAVENGDDLSIMKPKLAGLSPISSIKSEDDELQILREEVKMLKQKHAEELDYFRNEISYGATKREKMQISIETDDDKVKELESEIIAKQKEESISLQQLQLQYQAELEKYDYKLRETQQSHILELNNIENQHKFEREELKSQIRALTDSLERESQKDDKMHVLTEENKQLKRDKERIISNYDIVIKKLNNESEELIGDEIDKRIKETSRLKREINDLQQRMKRLNNKNDRLEIEMKQLQNENEQKDSVINQMRTMFLKEKKKNGMLVKSRRNSQKKDKEETVLTKGDHIRRKSERLENATVIMSKLDDGVSIIEIEKNVEDINQFDPTMDKDFDYDDNDKDEYEHNEEMALKDYQIDQLKGKINNLEANMDALKQQNDEELRLLQQKNGSLQQKIEIEQENFLKQNQMLQFKLKKQENDNKKNKENLVDLQDKHWKEIKILNNKIEKLTEKHIEKDEIILNLEENLDMIQEENGTLKQYKEDIDNYEREMDEMDENYQNMLHEMRIQNKEKHDEFNKFAQQKENENKNLQKTIHRHTSRIDKLQTIIRDSRESVISIDADYIRKDKMDELKEEMKMQHILEIDRIKTKNKEKYEKMKNELKNDIDGLINNNNELTNNLNETYNKLQETENNMKIQLEEAEISKIKLLQTFMKEMDRMRDEIKRLNVITRNQTK